MDSVVRLLTAKSKRSEMLCGGRLATCTFTSVTEISRSMNMAFKPIPNSRGNSTPRSAYHPRWRKFVVAVSFFGCGRCVLSPAVNGH